ncbi:PilZ domain-containing protein [Evansella cellulosilytica]|uniref:Type IV pilus assembly PilZ n=1 Tax=Evansella cellulosilytica (strain ATCC 21833 / DSM 2522 / FERM P-1141 / JCM 9156 / N-4) TaxID=649639 RepID=E6U2A3_EVAC2|nr:PilZ domain-containing protein [Evansella cellulosilytica]ADU30481.1 type IV pilus assembly PilZ [Evansella cellulosilytica DSM 2522]
MRYKREEPFRYEFGKPVTCHMHITSINDKKISSTKGNAEIMDISPKGIKLKSTLDLAANNNDIEVQLQFKLANDELKLDGKLMWQKAEFNDFSYGVELFHDEQIEQLLIKEIKLYSQNN